MQERVVRIRPLADPRREPPLAGVPVHGVDQVMDDRVRRSGDADRAALRDEREDLLGGGVGLPCSWWSLQRQVGMAERRSQPDCSLGCLLVPRANLTIRLGRPSQQEGGGRIPAADTFAHYPVTEIPEPFPQLLGADRTAFDQGRGQRTVIGVAYLQLDRPG